jgi:DNA polymerase I-like protein with 3'-5' exonuclease and polymerase domains
MNLQNVPKGGEMDDDDNPLVLPNVRKLFLPDPGFELFDMDLSSADLRVVVWEADEPEMKAMLAAGLDPYTEIAKEFYNDPAISKSDPRRQKFKSFAHGTNYLGTARGLATRLGLSVHEAERTQHWYFGRFRRIKAWQDNLCRQVQSARFVRNAFGYRRYFFDRIEGTVYNQAAAWIPQSTVGLLINRIWHSIRSAEPSIQILLQVHDSLVGQYPAAKREHYRARLAELSRIAVPYEDPLVIPTGFKTSTKSWGDC